MQSGPGAPTEKKSEPVSAAMVPHVAPPVAPAVAAPANSAAEISKPTRSSTEDTARSIPVREWAAISPRASPAQPVAPAAPISKAANESAEDTAHSIPKLAMTDWAAKLDNKSGAGDAEKASTPSASSTQSLSVGNIAKELAAQAKNAMAAESIPQAAASGAPNALDPAMVEAIVQRILDKMRPQVVEIITKEFLRSQIVQALLVQREIQKH